MILSIVAIIVVVLAIVVALQPSEFNTTRTALMAAAPSTVFPEINDLHRWQAWSPWAKMDPATENTYEGSQAGKGAILKWEGNNKVGQGRMTILESQPSERILMQLDFYKPFKATNLTEFNFKLEGAQTRVTWSMRGERNPFMKALGLVMNFDKIIGGQFDDGLASIKAIVEASPKA